MHTPPQELFDFSGKVVLVTGAGSGIGRAIALRFAHAGAAVSIHYLESETGANATAHEIAAVGGRVTAVSADLRHGSGAETIVDHTVATFGGIDVLINNAGIYPVAPLLDLPSDQWRDVIAANLDSVHYCTQAAARMMRERGGAVINIASIEALNPAPGHAHYTSAKAGVVMYTRTAARELGVHNIRVNCISPGLIWKEGLEEAWPEGVNGYLKAAPLGRLGQATDVADACLFFASPAASWVTGANLVVDGGVLTNRVF